MLCYNNTVTKAQLKSTWDMQYLLHQCPTGWLNTPRCPRCCTYKLGALSALQAAWYSAQELLGVNEAPTGGWNERRKDQHLEQGWKLLDQRSSQASMVPPTSAKSRYRGKGQENSPYVTINTLPPCSQASKMCGLETSLAILVTFQHHSLHRFIFHEFVQLLLAGKLLRSTAACIQEVHSPRFHHLKDSVSSEIMQLC